jgi:hypothetical protein
MDLTSTGGVQYRIDTPHLVLANATQRRQTSPTQDVKIVEQSFSPFLKFDLAPLDKVRLVTGIRGDIFDYDVRQYINTTGSNLNGRVVPWGLASSFEMRYLGDRPADPDRTAIAKGYTLFNLTTRYRHRTFEAFLSVENLADTRWRESQFFFTSRLPGEPAAGVKDLHFTPGNPRSFLGGIALRF